MTSIILVGSGNVAWHLAHIFDALSWRIVAIYSQKEENAQQLAQQLTQKNIFTTASLNLASHTADICFIALKDDVLPKIMHEIRLPATSIVVHTSGSQAMQILNPLPNPQGVFYPLQTFSKQKAIDFSQIPLCLEASDNDTLQFLEQLAYQISPKVYRLNSAQRATLHIAAVFACNFTNHLWACAKQITDNEQIDFELLQPLIQETLTKALIVSPLVAQTGPAKRKDNEIIAKHLAYLAEKHPNFVPLYELLTQSIIQSLP